jgi:hypothetical protein
MIRRISTTVTALAVALVFYALFTGLILNRIGTKLLQGPMCLHTPRTCPTCQANRPPTGVPIFGVRVPVASVTAASVMIMAMPLLAEYMTHRRRRLRYLNDECLECGRPIRSFRGHCPGCGVRIGPG